MSAIGDEIGRKIAAVELHTLDDVELGFGSLGLLDGDDAFVADLVHRLGDHLADGRVAIGGNRADLRDLARRLDLLGTSLDFLDDSSHRQVDAALEIHRIHAGGNEFCTLTQNGSREHRGCSGAIAGEVVGLGGHFADHLRAHVLELVRKLDFLGDGDAVLGDARRAVGLVDDDVAALGTERHLDGVVQNFDSAKHPVARIGGEFDFLGRHDFSSSSVLKSRIGNRAVRRLSWPLPSSRRCP